ncbi:MAG: holo-ACP synthase [Candidatus Pelagibacter sp.]
MSILGNGVDIVDNLRIKKSIKNNNFIKRIYSNDEIKESKNVKNKINFFAKRFAAKEAFVKSLGMGFRNGINFKDISVKNNNLGKPELYLNKKIKSFLSQKLKYKKYKIHLSLSDENRHSIAFVIINKI